MKLPLPTFTEERMLWERGQSSVLGIDEVGRGAFAGPVVVGGVVFPKHFTQEKSSLFWQIRDSKMVGKKEREVLSDYIHKTAAFVAIAEVGLSVINTIGIGRATFAAMRKVIANFQQEFGKDFFVLVDGFRIANVKGCPAGKQKAIVKGDQLSFSIAAASIVAKVHRDNLMKQIDRQYPKYFFEKNKGYGTREHQRAIRLHGLSEIHRKSFQLDRFLHSKTS